MYTTLSPCDMCTGACILYKVKRVVLGENNTFVGGEDYLKSRGIEVVNVENSECEQLMKKFIHDHPEDWFVYKSSSSRHKADFTPGMRTLVKGNRPTSPIALEQIAPMHFAFCRGPGCCLLMLG